MTKNSTTTTETATTPPAPTMPPSTGFDPDSLYHSLSVPDRRTGAPSVRAYTTIKTDGALPTPSAKIVIDIFATGNTGGCYVSADLDAAQLRGLAAIALHQAQRLDALRAVADAICGDEIALYKAIAELPADTLTADRLTACLTACDYVATDDLRQGRLAEEINNAQRAATRADKHARIAASREDALRAIAAMPSTETIHHARYTAASALVERAG